MTEDLVTWLRARLDEDAYRIRMACTYSAEAFAHGHADTWSARRAAGSADSTTFEIWASVGALKPHYTGITADVMTNMSAYLEVFDPRRQMAEVKAKRLILDEHPVYAGVRTCCPDGTTSAPCLTVRALALPYADQPGYLDEWRP